MNVLEDELRATFTAAVQQAVPLDDPAGTAIRRGRGIRRRRTAVTGAAVMAATVGLAGGLVWVQGWRTVHGGGTPIAGGYVQTWSDEQVDEDRVRSAPPPPKVAEGPPAGLDMVAAGELWTTEGTKVPLGAGTAAETRAYRLPSGWLVDTGGQLSMVSVDGRKRSLTPADSWTVDATGKRLAYVLRARLHVADVAVDGLRQVAETAVPANAVAVTFLGTRVVLGEVRDGTIRAYDHWSTTGAYRPTWTAEVRGVYGMVDGTPLGLAVGDDAGTVCLAELDVTRDGFTVTRTTGCDLGLGAAVAVSALSPDGRWLAVRRSATVAFYDVASLFDDQMTVTNCSVSAVPGAVQAAVVGKPIWEGPESLLAADATGAVRCRTDGTVERVKLPSDTPEGWLFVSRMAPASAK